MPQLERGKPAIALAPIKASTHAEPARIEEQEGYAGQPRRAGEQELIRRRGGGKEGFCPSNGGDGVTNRTIEVPTDG
jgi:hypothetical protein